MADEIHVDVDQAAVRELFSSWAGPVGVAVGMVAGEVEAIARELAPVSPAGSVFAPPGYLREHVHQAAEHHYDDQGRIIGLVGAPVYPFAFISTFRSRRGFTVNARSAKHPGRMTVRPAHDRFLERAIEIAPHITVGKP